jgi:hypothetical protein
MPPWAFSWQRGLSHFTAGYYTTPACLRDFMDFYYRFSFRRGLSLLASKAEAISGYEVWWTYFETFIAKEKQNRDAIQIQIKSMSCI